MFRFWYIHRRESSLHRGLWSHTRGSPERRLGQGQYSLSCLDNFDFTLIFFQKYAANYEKNHQVLVVSKPASETKRGQNYPKERNEYCHRLLSRSDITQVCIEWLWLRTRRSLDRKLGQLCNWKKCALLSMY